MSVDPSFVPLSLRNLAEDDGRLTGIRFAYRLRGIHSLFYVIHRMSLYLDGVEVKQPNLRITCDGVTVRAENLPESDWVGLAGTIYEVAANLPGGLRPGVHRVRLEAVFGGYYGRGAPGAPVVLCDFTAEC